MRSLLMINTTGDLVLGDLDSGAVVSIGDLLDPQSGARVTTAVFSSAGEWTAWSVDDGGPGGLHADPIHELRVHDEQTDTARVFLEGVSAFYLCPSPCGRYLSHLSPGPLGLELAVSDVGTDEIRIVERGQPLFWSWSPDGSMIAAQAEGRVLVWAVDEGETISWLSEVTGPSTAPVWLSEESVAYAVDDRIVSHAPGSAPIDLVANGATARFTISPDRRRLAMVSADEGVVLVDLASGSRVVALSEPALAFFWSPDSTRLAVLTPRSSTEVAWTVTDGDHAHTLPPFRPGRLWLGSVVPFFAQYAQSHSFWSPEGTEIVAVGLDSDGQTSALVQTVDAPHTSDWLPGIDLAWWAGD